MSNGIRVFSAGSLTVLAVILIIALIIFIVPLLVLGIIGAAFARLGFSWITALAVIILIVLGSGVNLPIYKIKRDIIRLSEINSNGFDTGEQSRSQAWETIVSVNLGGAIIPLAISAYLIYRAGIIVGSPLAIPLFVGVIAVSVITFIATRSFPRVGLEYRF